MDRQQLCQNCLNEKGRLRFLVQWLDCTRRGATCLHGSWLSKVEACAPFCTGEETKAIREWKIAMRSWCPLRLFTLEVFLCLRRSGDRAGLELIQLRSTLSRHLRAGVHTLAQTEWQMRQWQQAKSFTY